MHYRTSKVHNVCHTIMISKYSLLLPMLDIKANNSMFSNDKTNFS